ncbi:MAG: carbonic anhydrase [Candidatus Hydrogenedentota bacterium]
MGDLDHLLRNNRAWAADMEDREPGFFERLSHQQTPEFLWIGCSDSRVPANVIVGLAPGEIFVHRNVSNLAIHTDINCLSVMQFAVDVLKVKHIIVCGHYRCGGILAALRSEHFGIVDIWLRHVQDVQEKHQHRLNALSREGDQWDRLCELNVIEQVVNVCHSAVVRNAWERGQAIAIHGWIYKLSDGIIRDLHMTIASPDQIDPVYKAAIAG